jgi:hypothetical protein
MTLSGLTCWRNILNSLSIYSLVVAINFIAMGALLHFTLASVSLKSELCFRVAREPELQEWINHPNRKEKMRYSVTQDMSDAIDRFYFNHYCKSFRSGAFARASSSMYVLFDRYLADALLRFIFKPDGEHARSVDVPHPSRAL